MKPHEYDLTGGVPVLDVPRGTRGTSPDFVIYDNVVSPDGKTLIQKPGKAYHGRVSDGDGELKFEIQRVDNDLPFGVIGRYSADYYLANRSFVDNLESKST
jgi:hypothetical protein